MRNLFVLLCFVACSSNIKTPEWFLMGKQNDEQFLYGYGAGSTKGSAEYEALANLKERVYTTISSEEFMQDVAVNSKVQNEYFKKINAKTINIAIQNYEISQIKEEKGTIFVEIKTDRKKVADWVFDNLKQQSAKILPKIIEYENTQNVITKLQVIENLKEMCEKYMQIEKFYNGMGFAMPQRVCTPVLQVYHNFKIENTVQIAHTNPVVEEILFNIFSKWFTILQNSPNVISYKTTVKTENISGSDVASVKIDILQNNTQGGTYSKHCIGSSSQSKQKAVETAYHNCLMQSKGLLFGEFFEMK